MAFRRSDLQEAFFVPGTYPFRVWGYGTTDPLEEVLAPGYLEPARVLLRPGELIYVSVTPGQAAGAGRGATRMALVMVRASAQAPERADGSVRLVHARPTRRRAARLAPMAELGSQPGVARGYDRRAVSPARPGEAAIAFIPS